MESQSQTLGSEQVARSEAQQADAPTDEELTRRYTLAINDLVDDALRRGKHRIVVDALTWHLARFIANHGAVAAGYILEQVGTHTSYLTQRAQAQAESEQAKQEGRKTN